MPLPSTIADLSTTPGSNSPGGGETPGLIDDYLRLYSAFIAQLRDGTGFTAVKSNDIGSASAPAFSFVADSNTGIFSPTADTLAATTGGTERLRIDASGRVGIGTASPAALLHVQDSTTASATPSAIFWRNNGGFTPANQVGLSIYTNASNGFLDTTLSYGNTVNSYLAIGHHNGTAYAERLRIDASGNVGLGTTSPISAFDVRRASGGTVVASASATNYGFMQWVDASTALRIGTDGAFPIRFDTNAIERMRIDASGNVGVGTTAPTVPVDANGAIRTRPVTVATLPSASTAGAGSRHFVTDSNATTFAAVVAGGGANGVPVYSDGTNWRIG